MHAKTMVVDDELSVVASINLDPLSLNKLGGGGAGGPGQGLRRRAREDLRE